MEENYEPIKKKHKSDKFIYRTLLNYKKKFSKIKLKTLGLPMILLSIKLLTWLKQNRTKPNYPTNCSILRPSCHQQLFFLLK